MIKGQNTAPFIPHLFRGELKSQSLDETFKFVDFNNDGKEDIITNMSSQYSGNIAYIIKNTNSSFDTLHAISTGAPVLLTLDWNGDGLIDLITHDLQLKLNLANFNFDTLQALDIGSLDKYVGAADINNDGFIDLYGWDVTRDSIVIAFNQLGGTILKDSLIFMPYGAYYNTSARIYFGDYDGDGIAELFYRNANSIYLYQDLGGVSYTKIDSLEVSANFTTSLYKNSFFLRDMDNDGKNELIFTSDHSSTWDLYIYNSTVGSNFNQRFIGDYYYQSTNGYGGTAIQGITQVYDVDQNGQLDILVGNSVFFGNGNFTFNKVDIMTPPKLYKSGIKCTDYDGDGNTDICFPYNSSGQIFTTFSKVTNNGSQVFSSITEIWAFIIEYTNDYAVDYDNDGDIDLVGVYSRVYFKENIDDTLYVRIIGSTGYTSGSTLIVGNFNGDQYDDFISLNSSTINSGCFLNNGNNGYTIIGTGVSNNIDSYGVLDSDNDGVDEAFMIYRYSSSGIRLLKFDALNGSTVVLDWSDSSPANSKIKFGDVNQDGFKDVVISNTAGGGNKIRILLNDGAGTFSLSQTITTAITGISGVIDATGDFYPDILAYYSGIQYLFTNDGTGSFVYSGVYTTLNNPTSFNQFSEFTFDYNNDNNEDLLFFGNTSNTIFTYTNTGGNLSSSTSPWVSTPCQRVKDVDLDGDLDVLSSGGWYENTTNNLFNVRGYLYYDLDSNGTYSISTDIPISNGQVQISQLNTIISTDSTGYFDVPVGNISGNYNVEWVNNYFSSFSVNSSPYPAVALVDSLQPIDTVWIGIINNAQQILGNVDNTLVGNRCNEVGRLFLNYSNFIAESVNAQVDLKLASNTSFVSSSEVTSYTSTDSLSWSFASLSAMSSDVLTVDAMLPSTSFIGDTMLFNTKLTLTDLNGNVTYYYDTLQSIVTCAYDPNDKNITENESIYISDSIYAFTDEIEYLIRFQNTGNDTAQNIMIFDHINELFDINSFRPVSASHNYSLSIDSNRNLSVYFDNIYLPDSTIDFINSMGFVKFLIKYDSLSPMFVPVKNTAKIYFDYNPPILTNQHIYFRADCKSFINLTYDTTSFCAPDSLVIFNNDFSFPLKYTWVVGGDTSTSLSNSVTILIDSAGNTPLNIHIENNFCQYDTVSTVSIAIEKPNIQLSIQDSAFICPQGVVSSNIQAYWYENQSLTSVSSSWQAGYNSSQISAVTSSSPTCKDSISIYVNVIGNNLSFHELDTGSYFSSFQFCNDTLLTIQSNIDTLIWEVYLFTSTGNTLIRDTSSTFSVFLPANSTQIRILAYKDTLGCLIQHSTFLFLNNNPLIITGSQNNIFCNIVNPELTANTLVDWYVDSVYIETSFNTTNFSDSSIVIAKNYCGYSDTTTVSIVNKHLLSQYPDSLLLMCWEDTLSLQDSFFSDAMISWEGKYNNSIIYSETDSLSHFYLPAQYSNLSLTAQYTYRGCLLEKNMQIIKMDSSHSVINGVNQLSTDDGEQYLWYYSSNYVDFYFLNDDSIISISSNGFYFYKDTIFCANFSDTIFINSFSSPNISFLSQEICDNDSVLFSGSYVNAQSVYVDSSSSNTFDVLDLTVNSTYYYSYYYTTYLRCPGNYVVDDGTVLYVDYDTTFRFIYSSVKGCDSIVDEQFLIANDYYLYDTVSVCKGDNFIRPNGTSLNNILANTSVFDFLYTTTGCDSIIETYINVMNTYSSSSPVVQQYNICSNLDYSFPDGSYAPVILNDTIQYSYLLTSIGQCDSVVKTVLNISVLDTTVIQNGDQLISIQQNASLEWINCDDNTIVGTNQTLIVTSGGSYALIVNFPNCSDTSSCYFIQASGIEEYYLNASVYPNPSDGDFFIDLPSIQSSLFIYIFDINGKLIYKDKFKNKKKIKMSTPLETGMYFIKIETEFSIYNIPIIINNSMR